ncbi:MAG: hypothetical protein PHT58_00065 [Eubacteriales bacterium]|nr:hypothetical protein [Eubacteriales bacterium]
MKLSLPKRLLAIVLTLCLMIPAVALRISSAEVTFTGIDTLMIYNPLIYYEEWVYNNGWSLNVTENALSTGNMIDQIKTSSGNVLNSVPSSQLRSEGGDIVRLTPQQVRQLTNNEYLGAVDGQYELASTTRAVGDTKSFWIQPNLSSSSTRASTSLTCRAVGTYCNIWGNSTFTNTSVASQMAAEFDSVIYANDTSYFGSARFAEDGVKVNILVYTITYGGSSGSICGYFTGSDLYTSSELGSSASSYNTGSPIVHLNAYFCNATYLSTAYVTMAHEFQHLICFTSTLKNSNNSDEVELGTWLNESMAMAAEEISYQGEVASQGYINGSYNTSGDIAGGQSLYCFDTDNDIGVYGQGFLFSEYLKQQYGSTGIFSGIHSTWRTSAASLLNDGADLETALGGTVVNAINNSMSYDSSIISSINSTDNSTDTTSDSVSVFLSKLNLNFQIATVLKQSSGVYSLGSVCADADPKLNTATTVSIQGGGRIFVQTSDGDSYTVPTGADSKLIYVGFKNGEMVFAPTTAADYTPSSEPSAVMPASLSIITGNSSALAVVARDFTPTSYTWTSSDPSVATISSGGASVMINGIKAGTSIVSCVVTDGTVSLTRSCTVSVFDVVEYRQVTTLTAGKEYLLGYASGSTIYLLSKTPQTASTSRYPCGQASTVSTGSQSDTLVFTLSNYDYAASPTELHLTAAQSGTSWTFVNTDGNYLAFDSGGYPVLTVSTTYNAWTVAASGNNVTLKNTNWTDDNFYYLGWNTSLYYSYSSSAVNFCLYEKVESEPIVEGTFEVTIPASTAGINFGETINADSSGTRTQSFQVGCIELANCTITVVITSQNSWTLVDGAYSFPYEVPTQSFTFNAVGTQTGSCVIDLADIAALNLPTGNYSFTDRLTFTITSNEG